MGTRSAWAATLLHRKLQGSARTRESRNGDYGAIRLASSKPSVDPWAAAAGTAGSTRIWCARRSRADSDPVRPTQPGRLGSVTPTSSDRHRPRRVCPSAHAGPGRATKMPAGHPLRPGPVDAASGNSTFRMTLVRADRLVARSNGQSSSEQRTFTDVLVTTPRSRGEKHEVECSVCQQTALCVTCVTCVTCVPWQVPCLD